MTVRLAMGLLAGMLVTGAAPAAGQGAARVPLNDVLALARDYPNLVLQVRLQLVRANLKRDQVTCAARSLPVGYGKLVGTAVAPYTCAIGRRTIEISARQTYYDANGYRLGSDAAAMARAVRVSQANLSWRWR